MSLDLKMFVFLTAVIPLILSVLMIIYWHSRKTYRGFGFWVLANSGIGLGLVLVMLRTQVPDFLSIVVGNAIAIYGISLLYDGIQLFFERPAFNSWNQVTFGVFLLAQLFLTYVAPSLDNRIILFSLTAALLTLRIGLTLLRHSPSQLRKTCRSIATIFFVTALISFLRAVYTFFHPLPIDLYSDLTFAAVTFGYVCVITAWTFYLFFLNSARLELDLDLIQKDLLQVGEADRRKVIQLGLLDETSRSLAESLDEMEIMQRTVRSVVSRFGYAEAAISLLVEGDQLEIAAIDGTEDIGYQPGFRQKMGEGIIGHTAEKRSVYISGDIENDPFYFTIGKRGGSAVCVPMLDENQLLGVLYVESITRNAFDQDDIQTLDTLIRHAVTAIQKARLYAGAQAHLRAMSTMHSVTQTILASLELPQIFQSVVQLLKDTYNYKYVSIYLLDGQDLRLGAQAGYPDEMVLFTIPATTGITGRSVQTRQVQFVRDVSTDPAFLRASHDVESEICVPILREELVLGVLNVEAAPGRPLSEYDVEVLTALAGPVVIAIENARLHAEVMQLAMTDGLTNLANRRAFDLVFASELERAARYHYPLALMIIDMDSFKNYNDHWGHPAGDERLKAVAELLRGGIRSPDVVARYGGEEFALILPHTSKASAVKLAERLRAEAEKCAPSRFEAGAPIPGYTVSMGVAAFPEDGKNAPELLQAADQAEMAAKKMGKNRVCEAGDGVTTEENRI